MENTNLSFTRDYAFLKEGGTLSINCFDSIEVRARVTFDSEIVEGFQVTYWQDDDNDVEQKIRSIFTLLFEEVIKTRESSKKSNDI